MLRTQRLVSDARLNVRLYTTIKDRKTPLKGSRPSVPHGTNFFSFHCVSVFFCVCSFYSMDLRGLIQIKKERRKLSLEDWESWWHAILFFLCSWWRGLRVGYETTGMLSQVCWWWLWHAWNKSCSVCRQPVSCCWVLTHWISLTSRVVSHQQSL